MKTREIVLGIPIWLVAGQTSYNINVLRNHSYRVEWCFIDWGRITDRDGKFPWSRVAENIIDDCGFDINGAVTTRYPTNAINTHAWKEVYIEDNIITNVGTNSGDGKAIILDHSTDKTKYICDGVVVRRNIVSGVRHSKLGYAGGIHMSKATNCKIYNNISYNNQSGISLEGSLTLNNEIYNNTLDGNDYGIKANSGNGSNVLKNNAITNNKILGIANNSGVSFDYNGFFGNKDNYYSSAKPGVHDINADPKYLNKSNQDYRISSSSPFIDKGYDMGLSTDILGNIIQNKMDIGAYEYSSSPISSKPTAPSLNSPSNGSSQNNTSITLDWNSSNGATSYTLQVSENSNFSSPIVDQSGITSSSKQVSVLKNDTKYYWHVNAKNSVGTSSWSSTYNFSTSSLTSSLSAPSLRSPANGSTGVSLEISLDWNSTSGADSYSLQVSETSSFSSTVVDQGEITSSNKQVTGLKGNTKYYWRVNAANSDGTSPWSSTFNFTTDITSPPTSNSSFILTNAETALRSGDVRLKSKTGSKGNKVMYFLNSSSTAKFTINLDKSGQWYAWGRMFFESAGSPRNSFYLQVDNGKKLTFGNSNNSSFDEWHWEGDGSSKLSLGNLSSGSHTITIYGKEIGSGTCLLDQLLFSADANFVASDEVVSNNNSNSNGCLVYAAEDLTLKGDVNLKVKSGSKGNEVLYFLNTSATAKFTVNFEKAGQWYVWGRMFFESDGSPRNSFYIQIDNGDKLIFGNSSNSSFDKWHWEGDGSNELSLGNLSSGNHIITIYGKEIGSGTCLLDQILFTKDANYVPNDDNIAFSKTTNNLAPNSNTESNIENPTNYELSQNYPNPFNPSTNIKYSIPQEGLVSLKVYDILGSEVMSLVNEVKSQGTYTVNFNASHLTSGVYIYKLIAPNFVETKKMLLIK